MRALVANHRHVDSCRNGSQFLRIVRHLIALSCVVSAAAAVAAQSPATGSKAPDFTLSTPTRGSVSLAKETAKGTTGLVVLRGFPGDPCPYCVKQGHGFFEPWAEI